MVDPVDDGVVQAGTPNGAKGTHSLSKNDAGTVGGKEQFGGIVSALGRDYPGGIGDRHGLNPEACRGR